jgi:hypothetical protein
MRWNLALFLLAAWSCRVPPQHDEWPYVKSILIEQSFVVLADDDGRRQRCHFDVLPISVADTRCRSIFVFCMSSSGDEAIAPGYGYAEYLLHRSVESALRSQCLSHSSSHRRGQRHFHVSRHSSAKVVWTTLSSRFNTGHYKR